MNPVQKNMYYQSYMGYMAAIVHSLLTHKNAPMLSQASADFEAVIAQTINLKKFKDDELLFESLSQLTFSLHQLVKSGFSSEVRGMLHHPLEDILNHIIHYLKSLDDVAMNDPMLFIIEDEIDVIEDVRDECVRRYPRDAHALTVFLAHLKDMAMCLHSLNH